MKVHRKETFLTVSNIYYKYVTIASADFGNSHLTFSNQFSELHAWTAWHCYFIHLCMLVGEPADTPLGSATRCRFRRGPQQKRKRAPLFVDTHRREFTRNWTEIVATATLHRFLSRPRSTATMTGGLNRSRQWAPLFMNHPRSERRLKWSLYGTDSNVALYCDWCEAHQPSFCVWSRIAELFAWTWHKETFTCELVLGVLSRTTEPCL